MMFDFLFSMLFFFFLPVLWLIREMKAVNFWLYLWQLKEYRADRFIDHFQTFQGKKLLLDKIVFFKIILILVISFGISYVLDAFDPEDLLHLDLFLGFSVIGTIFFIYILEGVKLARDFFCRTLRIPVPTKKIITLRLSLVFITILWMSYLLFSGFLPFFFFYMNPIVGMLLYDVFTPIIVLVVVLMVQPFAAIAKNRIIQKAIKRREVFQNLKVIGITGSYGKTSVKEFLCAILSKKYKVLKTEKHINTEIGVAKTVLENLTKEHEVFICEMGAYKKGEVKTSCDMVKPNIGIITGINEQHLSLFGSMENLLSAEGGKELIQALFSKGVVFANADSKVIWQRKSELEACNPVVQKFMWCSTKTKTDVWAEQLVVEKDSLRFVAHLNEQSVELQVNVVGGYNVENLLLAVGAAVELGMSLDEIRNACQTITQELGAMKLQKTIHGLNVVESTYSANPDGVMAALEYLNIWQKKKIIIMPCLIELGKASKEAHKRIGEKIAEICDLAIITTKDYFEDIKNGSDAILYIEDAQEIVRTIKNMTSVGDVVLLEGRVPAHIRALL